MKILLIMLCLGFLFISVDSIDPCRVYNDDCESCIVNEACGYIQGDDKCVTGDVDGPFEEQDYNIEWNYYACGYYSDTIDNQDDLLDSLNYDYLAIRNKNKNNKHKKGNKKNGHTSGRHTSGGHTSGEHKTPSPPTISISNNVRTSRGSPSQRISRERPSSSNHFPSLAIPTFLLPTIDRRSRTPVILPSNIINTNGFTSHSTATTPHISTATTPHISTATTPHTSTATTPQMSTATTHQMNTTTTHQMNTTTTHQMSTATTPQMSSATTPQMSNATTPQMSNATTPQTSTATSNSP